MSRRPGIAADWFKMYKRDVYPKDFTTIRGKIIKPPKFYDKLLEEESIEEYEKVKLKRIHDAKKRKEDNSGLRLLDKEKVKKAQVKMLIRPLDKDQ